MLDGAEELAKAGYAWEIADAPILHRALNLADLAHVLELLRIKAIPEHAGHALIGELLHLADSPDDTVRYDPEFGEMYSSRERYFAGRIGDDAGWLHAGRTRREAMRIAYRIVVRRQVLTLVTAAADLVEHLCLQGRAHIDTVMPDYTYLQPAQPTTFGHYILSFADPVLRDAGRLVREFADINASPVGSGAASGSALLSDREGPGHDLGFDGPIHHVRDAMWQSDPFTHALLAATTLVIAHDKLAEDLEIFTSREFGFVTLGDGLVRPSVLMPQKRNPYALTVIRGVAGIMIGRSTGQLTVTKSPSARSDLYIYAYGEVPRSLDLAIRATELTSAVVRTLSVDAGAMKAALEETFTEAADIATFLMQRFHIDYRSAHSIVAAAVDYARADARPLSPHDISRSAQSVVGRSLDLTDDELAKLTDPVQVAESHDGLGGSARTPMLAFADDRTTQAIELRDWAGRTRDTLDLGEADLLRRARAAIDHEEATETP